jgi:hypothetical protein
MPAGAAIGLARHWPACGAPPSPVPAPTRSLIKLPRPQPVLTDGPVTFGQGRRLDEAFVLPDVEILLSIMAEAVENEAAYQGVQQGPWLPAQGRRAAPPRRFSYRRSARRR